MIVLYDLFDDVDELVVEVIGEEFEVIVVVDLDRGNLVCIVKILFEFVWM